MRSTILREQLEDDPPSTRAEHDLEVRNAVRRGELCPRCGSRGEHEHNVDSSSFICADCHEPWDREDADWVEVAP